MSWNPRPGQCDARNRPEWARGKEPNLINGPGGCEVAAGPGARAPRLRLGVSMLCGFSAIRGLGTSAYRAGLRGRGRAGAHDPRLRRGVSGFGGPNAIGGLGCPRIMLWGDSVARGLGEGVGLGRPPIATASIRRGSRALALRRPRHSSRGGSGVSGRVGHGGARRRGEVGRGGCAARGIRAARGGEVGEAYFYRKEIPSSGLRGRK